MIHATFSSLPTNAKSGLRPRGANQTLVWMRVKASFSLSWKYSSRWRVLISPRESPSIYSRRQRRGCRPSKACRFLEVLRCRPRNRGFPPPLLKAQHCPGHECVKMSKMSLQLWCRKDIDWLTRTRRLVIADVVKIVNLRFGAAAPLGRRHRGSYEGLQFAPSVKLSQLFNSFRKVHPRCALVSILKPKDRVSWQLHFKTDTSRWTMLDTIFNTSGSNPNFV